MQYPNCHYNLPLKEFSSPFQFTRDYSDNYYIYFVILKFIYIINIIFLYRLFIKKEIFEDYH